MPISSTPSDTPWSVFTVKEEMSVDEMHRRFRAMMPEKKKPAVDPVPKGYSTLTTYLVAQDADVLIDFLKKTFDAEELFRGGAPDRRRPALRSAYRRLHADGRRGRRRREVARNSDAQRIPCLRA